MKAGAGIDLGRRTVRLTEVSLRKSGPVLTRYLAAEVGTDESPAEAAGDFFSRFRVRAARAGLTGADLMLRYLPVPEVEDWRLERLMDFEVRELESKSGAALASAFNLLPVPRELDDEDTMLLGLVREELLEEWLGDLARLRIEAFTPNAIALYNAYLTLGDHAPAVTLLANVGAGTLDLALVRGTDLYFARSVTTGLEDRDRTLGERLGLGPRRAERLIHKHLDLKAAVEGRLAAEADQVTRPLLPLYDTLANLLTGAVTLCKAQARLRDLTLDRVLLTGGGARARGLEAFLQDRLRVPVTVWNPVELVDRTGLPDDQARQAEGDGPGAAVGLGLALSSADPDLFALEILPRSARRRRIFRERGVFTLAAAGLALVFLAADFLVTSGRASEAAGFARQIERRVAAREGSHRRTTGLLGRVERLGAVRDELAARAGVRRTAEEVLLHLSERLPETLWVDTLEVGLTDGADWDLAGRALPAFSVGGRGKDGSLPVSSVFAAFGEDWKQRVPGGERAVRNTTQGAGRSFGWGVRGHLLAYPEPEGEEEPR